MTSNSIPLRQVAEILETVLGTLNLDSSQCPGCDKQLFSSWDDRQMHVELSAIVRKLRRFANSDSGQQVRDMMAPRNNRNSVGWIGDPPGAELPLIDHRS